jgi:hypothetical protein
MGIANSKALASGVSLASEITPPKAMPRNSQTSR